MTDPGLRRLVMLLARLPGWPIWGPRLLARLRRSASVRWLQRRLRREPGRRRDPAIFGALPSGRSAATDTAVVLVICIGLGDDDLETLAERIDQAQRICAGAFAPVFAIDSPAVHTIGRRGHPVERLLPREEWSAVHGDAAWGEDRAARVAALRKTYGASGCVVVEGIVPSLSTLLLLPALAD
jgi:hypothetical protein